MKIAMKVTRSSIQGLAATAGRGCLVVVLLALGLSATGCLEKAEEVPPPTAEPLVDPNDVLDAGESSAAPTVDPTIPELTINKEAQVSVLGYHDFITGRSTNPMMINIDKFRSQMQALKDADIPVIPGDFFIAARHVATSSKCAPARTSKVHHHFVDGRWYESTGNMGPASRIAWWRRCESDLLHCTGC